jgi:hypothetical protein
MSMKIVNLTNKLKYLDIYIKNEKMKNTNNKYLDNLVAKLVKETLEERADELTTKINKLGGMDDGHPKFGKLKLSKMSDEDLDSLMNSDVEDEDDAFQYDGDTNNKFDTEEELDESSEVCECGGGMYEGICEECGYNQMEEGIDDKEDLNGKFDYVEEEVDFEDEEETEDETESEDKEACKYHMDNFGPEDERTQQFCGSNKMGLDKYKFSINERLRGRQRNIDKNKNNKIDAEDFEMLRKGETKEGEKILEYLKEKYPNPDDLDDDEYFDMIHDVRSRFKLSFDEGNEIAEMHTMFYDKGGSTYAKGGKIKEGKKSVKLSESEMIDLIEKLVREEKASEQQTKNIKSAGKPKGLAKYEQIHTKDGKENNEYLKSVTKKMKDYLKDGSKGDFDMNPKMFPKGNGELSKMETKAYIPSTAVEEYIDNFTAAALENLDYDEIRPNEEWVTDNIEGSSRTGNNPEWANTGESDVNKKRNKIRKDNMLAKLKRKAYNKAPQPVVSDNAGEDKGSAIMAKLESTEPKQAKQINEEFDRIKSLMGYNQKTQ